MRGRILPAATLLALALPAAAAAETYEVGADKAYTTIPAALAAADPADGPDAVRVFPGTYPEAVAVDDAGVTIEATAPGAAVVTGPVTVNAAGTTLRSLVVTGATPITVNGQGTRLDGVGAVGTAAAVLVQAHDVRIQRSLLRGDADAADALRVDNPTGLPRAVAVDSTVLTAGRDGAGVHVTTSPPNILMNGGAVEVGLVQATVAGPSSKAVVREVAGTLVTGGPITVTATRSILQGDLGGATLTAPNDTTTPAAQIFRDPAGGDFRLRADAPVIDKGGAVGAGEADKDFEGDPRAAGAATDLGADEFANQAPTAGLAVSSAAPRVGTPVTFTASGADPEAGVGGGIARYEWDFGDGRTAVTTTPTADHAYANAGPVRATVRVVDAQGAATAAGVDVGVLPPPVDGEPGETTPPTVRVASPLLNAALRGTRTVTVRRKGKRVRRSKPVAIRFFGTAQDASGVARVEVALRLVKKAARKKPTKAKAKASQAAARCTWLTPRMFTSSRSCESPLFQRASYDGSIWSFRTKSTRALTPGSWMLVVRATDKAGNARTTTLRFTVR